MQQCGCDATVERGQIIIRVCCNWKFVEICGYLVVLEISIHKLTLSDLIDQFIVTLAVFSCNCVFPWVQTNYTINLSTNCVIRKIDIYNSCDQVYVMGRNNRVTTMEVKNIHNDIFLKTLSTEFFGRFSGKFMKENTIIIDKAHSQQL